MEDVNAAIKKYLQTDNYDAVIVTANAQQLKDTLQKDEPSPKTYNAQPAPRSSRRTRRSRPLKVEPTRSRSLRSAQVFQK